MSEKKIDLIAQLLTKAESTTPEEAEALTAAAEKLMVKYMIDQATIDARRAKAGTAGEKIVEVAIRFGGVYRGEMIHMGASIAGGLKTIKVMQSTGSGSFTLWFVGFESDVAQAKALLESLQIQSMVAVAAWWKLNKSSYQWDTGYDQEKARRSFVHGFGTGAGSRIAASRLQTVTEAGTGTELVLVSREAKVQAHMDSRGLRKSRSRTATGRDYAAAQGVHAGKNANTGEKNLTQGRGISA